MIEFQQVNNDPHELFAIRDFTTVSLITSKTPVGGGVPSANPQQGPCPSELPYNHIALAETGSKTQSYFNDVTTVIFEMPISTIQLVYTLETWTGSAWVVSATLTNITHGTLYATGSFAANNKLTAFTVDWFLILALFGEGLYRIKSSSTVIGAAFETYSSIFCLKTYSATAADDTVLFEFNYNGVVGVDQPTVGSTINYSTTNIYQNIRVEGYFGGEITDNERVEVKYHTGRRKRTRDERLRKYEFTSGRLPMVLHKRLRDEAFFSDSLLVTDFNLNNPDSFTQVSVKMEGGYEPDYKKSNVSKLSRVVVEFTDGTQNLIGRDCFSGQD